MSAPHPMKGVLRNVQTETKRATIARHHLGTTLCCLIALPLVAFIAPAGAENIVFPADAGVLNVKNYGATGNGATDDSDAIQAAIDAAVGMYRRRTVYFPDGTYLVTKTLVNDQYVDGKDPAGLILQGQSRAGVVLKLKNNQTPFNDPAAAKPVLDTSVTFNNNTGYSNDAFCMSVQNLTIDVGQNNPGAVGIHFFANNVGRLDQVTVRSSDVDKRGKIGVYIGHHSDPGPLLVKNIEVVGFDIGIRTRFDGLSATFEHITLKSQRVAGFRNEQNVVNIRRLTSTNAVTALVNANSGGVVCLLDSALSGGTSAKPAIDNQAGDVYLRNVSTAGYRCAVQSGGVDVVAGANVTGYFSMTRHTLSAGTGKSLNLPIEETPDVGHDPDLAQWASVVAFGATNNYFYDDDTPGIQAAIDSGASTIYFPKGNYRIKNTIILRGNVRRIVGLWSMIDPYDTLRDANPARPLFRFESSSQPTVAVEGFFIQFLANPGLFYFIDHASTKNLVLKDVWMAEGKAFRGVGTGKVFIENFLNGYDYEETNTNTSPVWAFSPGQRVWARQINPEHGLGSTDILNNGASVWIFGIKTERPSIVAETRSGGKTEITGGLIFPISTPLTTLAPFVNQESSVSLVVAEHRDASGNGRHYTVVKEVRGGTTRQLQAADVDTRGGANSAFLLNYTGVLP